MSTPTLIRWCTTCDLPEHRWDATDPLYPGSAGKCPDCTRADFDEEEERR